MKNAIDALTLGDKAPEVVTVVVEIPKGSHNKYEYDEHEGVFKLDRVLYSQVHYPADYGFIPETRSEDGDHLDVVVLGGDPLFPGCVLDVRPIGLLRMIDDGEPDFKILGVQKKNPRFATVNDIKDIEASNPHLLKEISHFFATYKQLENKKTDIQGWDSREAAIAEIKKAAEVYAQEST